MYKHILIATDGSDLAGKALEHGLSLAKALASQVTVVTAMAGDAADISRFRVARLGRRKAVNVGQQRVHVLAGQLEHRHLVVTANDATGFGVHEHFDRIAYVQVAKWDHNGMRALIIPSDRVAMSAF